MFEPIFLLTGPSTVLTCVIMCVPLCILQLCYRTGGGESSAVKLVLFYNNILPNRIGVTSESESH